MGEVNFTSYCNEMLYEYKIHPESECKIKDSLTKESHDISV